MKLVTKYKTTFDKHASNNTRKAIAFLLIRDRRRHKAYGSDLITQRYWSCKKSGYSDFEQLRWMTANHSVRLLRDKWWEILCTILRVYFPWL